MQVNERQIKTAIDFLVECRESRKKIKGETLRNMKAMQILGIESTLAALGIDFPKEELVKQLEVTDETNLL